jgi:hypothetical protein
VRVTSSQYDTDSPVGAMVAALVDTLLQARAQPAALLFDELLVESVGAGRLSPELAHELKFWQRTSVLELTDHVRSVLPAVLPVALTALASATDGAAAGAQAAAAAWRDRLGAAPEAELEDSPRVLEPAEAVPSAADGNVDANSGADVDVSLPDAANPNLRRRLVVAGLTSTA